MRYSNDSSHSGAGGCVYGPGWFAGEELACSCDAAAVEGFPALRRLEVECGGEVVKAEG